jgi:hypothetical protein
MKNLAKQLAIGFGVVSTKICEKIITKVREIDDEFWVSDIKMDAG